MVLAFTGSVASVKAPLIVKELLKVIYVARVCPVSLSLIWSTVCKRAGASDQHQSKSALL